MLLWYPLPPPQQERGLRWVPRPPDHTRDDLRYYIDGSLCHGPVWQLRRTGCSVVVVDSHGALVAYGAAVPPPWLRTAAAAELWALLLLLSETP